MPTVASASKLEIATSATIPVMRPSLPHASTILPYLEQIDANRWYSNSGPLEESFTHRLAALLSVANQSVLLTSNGTSALQVALRAVALPSRTKCLMPSWTFAATPLAAIGSGLQPHFVDIDPDTWALSPEPILAREDLSQVAAIVVVAPFGQPPDTAAWNHVASRTGIPVIIDAAAGFDSLAQTSAASRNKVPIIVSLHATKSFGIGEGGLLISEDLALIQRCAELRNFGFRGKRNAHSLGTNAKLSEYAAAVGLAALDEWPEKRSRFAAAFDLYATHLTGLQTFRPLRADDDNWIASTFNIQVAGNTERLMRSLANAGIETRRWWGSGCHVQPVFSDLPRDRLVQTELLAKKVVGLPLSTDITENQIIRICDALKETASH